MKVYLSLFPDLCRTHESDSSAYLQILWPSQMISVVFGLGVLCRACRWDGVCRAGAAVEVDGAA